MDNKYIIKNSSKFNWPRFLIGVLKRWYLLVLAAVIGFCAVFFTQEYNKTPRYTANATMFISSGRISEKDDLGVTYVYTTGDSVYAQQLIKAYNILLRTDVFRDQLLEDYGEDTVADLSKVSVSIVSMDETEFLTLYVTAYDPKLAVEMCNKIASSAPAAVKSVVKAGYAESVSEATYAYRSNPTSYNKSMLAALAGVVIVIGIMMLVFALDTRIKSIEDIKSNYNVPILGEIPSFDILRDDKSSRYATTYAYKKQ
ncbi:MAG TPA: hypothetical protein PLT66_00980 [Bacillota bacterium]|nr:hypothetical protein [Bacillota bacterium]